MVKKLPKLDVDDFEAAFDLILEFYKQVGWDSDKHELDPTKIKVNSEDWKKICTEIKSRWGLPGAMAWMNYGPCGNEQNDDYLTKGYVDVDTGAFVSVDVG
jgi:hypothetical protein